MSKVDANKTPRGVFKQPVRELNADEIKQVSGGYKREAGPDNQVKEWNSIP